MALIPTSREALDGPTFERHLARVGGWVGDRDAAIAGLPRLLRIRPGGLTVPLLKLDPAWDPLRTDPRFHALLQKYAKYKTTPASSAAVAPAATAD